MRKKKLVALGNSVGLIIDQGFLRMMRLRRGSIVTLECDGRTLIIRPTGEQDCDERRLDRRTVHREEDTDDGRPIDCEAARKAGLSTADFATLTARAPRVFEGLMRGSLPLESFRALFHGPVDDLDPKCSPALGWSMTLHRYSRWVESDARFDPTDAQLATMQRFEACYAVLGSTRSWADLVRHGLEEVPMVSDPDDTMMCERPESPEASKRDGSAPEVPEKPSPFMESIWALLGADEEDDADPEDEEMTDAEWAEATQRRKEMTKRRMEAQKRGEEWTEAGDYSVSS